jgi:hypothetical protein
MQDMIKFHTKINPRQHYRSKRFGLEDIPGPRMFCLMTKCVVSNGQKSNGQQIISEQWLEIIVLLEHL